IGFEIDTRIGREVSLPTVMSRGFHTSTVWGPLGAAAAASKLLGLNVEQTRNALGISAGTAAVEANFGSMTKSLHLAHAARLGVLAALLARTGFTGGPAIIEGFVSSWGDMAVDVERLTDDLASFPLATASHSFKPNPSCGMSH